MKKVACIVGTRPDFIKIAPLFWYLEKNSLFPMILIHTGQHYEFRMFQIFFRELKIPVPDYNLQINSPFTKLKTIIQKLETVLVKEKPKIIIVVGDVDSALVGALVACRLKIPIAHIEAGMRSFDRTMPEELNRVIIDSLSEILFAPTREAVENLKKEGINKGIYYVGDLNHEVLIKALGVINGHSRKILNKFHLKPKEYLLLTLHRIANIENPQNLYNILQALSKSKKKIVFPVHPHTKKQISKFKFKIDFANFLFLPPLSFLEMLVLEKHAFKILTDSGTIQKEAFWLKVPCITLREVTEWNYTVKEGWNILVGANPSKILDAISNFNPFSTIRRDPKEVNVASKIIETLSQYLFS